MVHWLAFTEKAKAGTRKHGEQTGALHSLNIWSLKTVPQGPTFVLTFMSISSQVNSKAEVKRDTG